MKINGKIGNLAKGVLIAGGLVAAYNYDSPLLQEENHIDKNISFQGSSAAQNFLNSIGINDINGLDFSQVTDEQLSSCSDFINSEVGQSGVKQEILSIISNNKTNINLVTNCETLLSALHQNKVVSHTIIENILQSIPANSVMFLFILLLVYKLGEKMRTSRHSEISSTNNMTRREFGKTAVVGLSTVAFQSIVLSALSPEKGVEKMTQNELNQLIADLGSVNFLGALMNAFETGHFTKKNVQDTLIYLVAYERTLSPERRINFYKHAALDTAIFSGISLLTSIGDILPTMREKMGKNPSSIYIPDGTNKLSSKEGGKVMKSLNENLLKKFGVNVIATGAAGIDFNNDLVQTYNRMFFTPATAKFNGSLQTFLDDHKDSLTKKEADIVRVEQILVKEIPELLKSSYNHEKINELLDSCKDKMAEVKQTIHSIGDENDENEIQQISDFDSLDDKFNDLYTELYWTNNHEKWDAVESHAQAHRSWTNLVGKLGGPFGDPPNLIQVIKNVLKGRYTFQRAIELQFMGFIKSAPGMIDNMVRANQKMYKSFSIEVDPSVSETYRQFLQDEFDLLIKAKTDILHGVLQSISKLSDPDKNEVNINVDDISDVLDDAADTLDSHPEVQSALRAFASGAGEKYSAMFSELGSLIGRYDRREYIKTANKNKATSETVLSDVFPQTNNIGEYQQSSVKQLESSDYDVEHSEHGPSKKSQKAFFTALTVASEKSVTALYDSIGLTEDDLSELSAHVKGILTVITDSSLDDEVRNNALSWSKIIELLGNKDLSDITNFLVQQEVINYLDDNPDETEAEKARKIKEIVKAFSIEPSGHIDKLYTFADEAIPAIEEKMGQGTAEVVELVGYQFMNVPLVSQSLIHHVINPTVQEFVPGFDLLAANDGTEQNEELPLKAVAAVITKLCWVAVMSLAADNAAVYNVCVDLLGTFIDQGYIQDQGMIDWFDQSCRNAAIEWGKGLPQGGPASVPFADEQWNALKKDWPDLLAQHFGNIPIPGLEEFEKDHFAVAGTLKSAGLKVFFEFLKAQTSSDKDPQDTESNMVELAKSFGGGVAWAAKNVAQNTPVSLLTTIAGKTVFNLEQYGSNKQEYQLIEGLKKIQNSAANDTINSQAA